MYLFLESAAGTAAAGSSASMILMFVVLIAVFYFFMIRPENKRKKEAQQMRPRGVRQVRCFHQQHGGKGSCQAEGCRSGCPQGRERKGQEGKINLPARTRILTG